MRVDFVASRKFGFVGRGGDGVMSAQYEFELLQIGNRELQKCCSKHVQNVAVSCLQYCSLRFWTNWHRKSLKRYWKILTMLMISVKQPQSPDRQNHRLRRRKQQGGIESHRNTWELTTKTRRISTVAVLKKMYYRKSWSQSIICQTSIYLEIGTTQNTKMKTFESNVQNFCAYECQIEKVSQKIIGLHQVFINRCLRNIFPKPKQNCDLWSGHFGKIVYI